MKILTILLMILCMFITGCESEKGLEKLATLNDVQENTYKIEQDYGISGKISTALDYDIEANKADYAKYLGMTTVMMDKFYMEITVYKRELLSKYKNSEISKTQFAELLAAKMKSLLSDQQIEILKELAIKKDGSKTDKWTKEQIIDKMQKFAEHMGMTVDEVKIFEEVMSVYKKELFVKLKTEEITKKYIALVDEKLKTLLTEEQIQKLKTFSYKTMKMTPEKIKEEKEKFAQYMGMSVTELYTFWDVITLYKKNLLIELKNNEITKDQFNHKLDEKLLELLTEEQFKKLKEFYSKK